jgi:hypothetical protein
MLVQQIGPAVAPTTMPSGSLKARDFVGIVMWQKELLAVRKQHSPYRDASAEGSSSQLLVAFAPTNLASTQASISALATANTPS